jgi:flagellar protein FliS
MFTQTRSPYHSLSTMYQKVQIDTGVETASAHHLVCMLFDGFFDACSQARGCIGTDRVEEKCRALGRAARIVDEGLKASLNLEAGGELAKNLSDLYAYVCVRLTHANLHNDVTAIEECQRLMRPIQSAWNEIGAQVETA